MLPTRVTSDTASCYDVYVTNLYTHETSGILTHDISDHLPILLYDIVLLKKKVTTKRNRFRFTKLDEVSLIKFRDLIASPNRNSECVKQDSKTQEKKSRCVMTLHSHAGR